MTEGFLCPVCAYSDPSSSPFANGEGYWAQEICPCCGTQFGYDDDQTSHAELRKRWVSAGAKWWSKSRHSPPNFDGLDQLKRASL